MPGKLRSDEPPYPPKHTERKPRKTDGWVTKAMREAEVKRREKHFQLQLAMGISEEDARMPWQGTQATRGD